jgi:NTP pyrophosphatase (non-canonical NTP hydrolase)
MNRTEHLLACLAEECTEVAKECTKAMRFGLEDNYDGTTPAEKIVHELVDILAVYHILVESGALKNPWENMDEFEQTVDIKCKKVEHYMEYARARGTLDKE